MLLERAAALEDKVKRFQALKSDALEAQAYANRAKQFRGPAERIEASATTWKALKTAGVPIAFSLDLARDLAFKADELRVQLATDPASLQDPDSSLKYQFEKRIVSIADAVNTAAGEAWRAWVDETAKLTSDDVLNALGTIPQLQPSVNAIRKNRLSLAALRQSTPADVAAAQIQVRTIVAAHNKAWTELTAEGLPPSVMAFIRACAGEGASLSMLDGEVGAWLEQRGLAGAFRIRIR